MIGILGRTLGHLVSEDHEILEEFEETENSEETEEFEETEQNEEYEETEESEDPEKSEDHGDPEKPRVGALSAPLPEPPSLLHQLVHGRPT